MIFLRREMDEKRTVGNGALGRAVRRVRKWRGDHTAGGNGRIPRGGRRGAVGRKQMVYLGAGTLGTAQSDWLCIFICTYLKQKRIKICIANFYNV